MKDRDFTVRKYSELLDTFRKAGYEFQPVKDFLRNPKERVVILRHDVDLHENAALRLAKVEESYGIKATYYFRKKGGDFDNNVINKIVALRHEIGYHYEDLTSTKGNYEEAIESFNRNLRELRKFYPITTICMHGRSGSPFDNKDLWNKYNYKNYGLIGEPYLDIDYNKVLYISDSQRCWNSFKYSLRDKVQSNYSYNFKRTKDIICNLNELPDQILITTHPEHWTNNLFEWLWIKLFESAHIIYKKYYRNKVVKKKAIKEN